MFNLKTNSTLINSEANEQLESIIETQSFANGYIFHGAEGLGKKETAIHFIHEIFKKYSQITNIEEKISNNNHPDLLVIKPAFSMKSKIKKQSNNEMPKKNISEIIKIDQIRSIKTFLSQKSIESEKKIVLIIDAHLLNEASSNCLLKTLEEPSNGIFILVTAKLNLLLDTIKSRCQLVRFRSFSRQEIESFFRKNLVNSKFDLHAKLNFQDLINSANGSPGKILESIESWNEIPEGILEKLEFPLKNNIDILEVCKLISEQLEIYQQLSLLHLIQQMWWCKTKNVNLIKKLENLKYHIKNNIQPRLAWEITFLKIALEDL